MTKVGILYIDIEGGWGGSSRSLFYLIKHLNKDIYDPLVICGRGGPIIGRYKSDGIEPIVFYPIPRTTAAQKKNLRSLARFTIQSRHFPKLFSVIRNLIRKHKVKIIHLNHESLFGLGILCRLFTHCKIVYHVRTMLPLNLWGILQIIICKLTAHFLVFITENEKELWEVGYHD